MVKIGLIGLGEIHRAHMRGYKACENRADIVAVCDRDAEVAERYAQEYGARAFQDYRTMLDVMELDAVDVMLPHSAHEAAAAAALENGRHVLVEKPLAPSLEATERLIAAAKSSGKLLAVAENTRFVEAYKKVEALVEAGEIGNVEFVRTMICGSEVARLQQKDLWKGRKDGTVGGVILDAGVHSFYLFRWLFGGVAAVGSRVSRRVEESEVEDTGVVFGRLLNGADFVSEFVFTAEIPWNERLEVYGSKGSCIVDQLSNPVVRQYRDRTDYEGVDVAGIVYSPTEWKQTSIAKEVVAFVDAVSGGEKFPVELGDIRNVISAVEAAYRNVLRDDQLELVR